MSSNKCLVCGKPLSPTSGDIGATCKAHQGKLRQSAQVAEKAPENWVRMSKVCEAAVKEGLTISAVVNAAGGDAAVKPVMDPVFQVVYVGRAKYMNPDVLTKGFALLKAHKAEKAAPKPKVETPAKAIEAKLQSVVKK